MQDVPTNLRAVKKAAIDVGARGVLAQRNGGSIGAETERGSSAQESEFADFILDYENETLGAYLA